MAGLYIHIPFCRSRCFYCDFFSSTSLDLRGVYVDALCEELIARRDFIGGGCFDSVYFGGGTPSLLCADDFKRIFDVVEEFYGISPNAEITLEGNPDDLGVDFFNMLKGLPFNRISIGVQSFKDDDLRRLGRRHSGGVAKGVVGLCREYGFDNVSIDLMYGLPFQGIDDWERNLDIALELNPAHISAYLLTYEPGTVLSRQLERGIVPPVDEDLCLSFFDLLVSKLGGGGYTQYEISNFARDGLFSRHNSSYWLGVPYLGIGASAHSFNGVFRVRNVSSLGGYLKGDRIAEEEFIDVCTGFNDYIVTRLRTMWGIDLGVVERLFGRGYRVYCEKGCSRFIEGGLLSRSGDIIRLTHRGMFLSDGIMSDLLMV